MAKSIAHSRGVPIGSEFTHGVCLPTSKVTGKSAACPLSARSRSPFAGPRTGSPDHADAMAAPVGTVCLASDRKEHRHDRRRQAYENPSSIDLSAPEEAEGSRTHPLIHAGKWIVADLFSTLLFVALYAATHSVYWPRAWPSPRAFADRLSEDAPHAHRRDAVDEPGPGGGVRRRLPADPRSALHHVQADRDLCRHRRGDAQAGLDGPLHAAGGAALGAGILSWPSAISGQG